ncbi:hypothetical protein JI749_02095 [Devosia oryziradicis]|uniref:Uncharacterized protein n=1 Tax=Devosia oryziradicis TaxID=2801335 RepID=A0ABX7BY69_9HYPH|nr:hypothetical protein [Devosia oryziradicis]QQR36452.1 hypothetical protein JI749_02095 [Devosia oryziradicis]
MANTTARRLNPRMVGWSLVAALLAAPLLAMQFTSEVNWGGEDFIAAALLLGGAGLALEATMRFVRGSATRIVLGLTILIALALIWAELAVGIL